jgi:protein-disulfide isomerase
MSILKQTFDIGRDHWQGSILAPVELVQFGDFQSSDCAEIFPEIKLLLETLGSRIRFVYLHFPLHKIHPFALDAAIASEAAAAQGKFWEMHDHLFETLEVRKASSFLVFARSIGLDMTQFTSDIRRKSLFYKVINDFESGKKSGVHNPPAFFINGHRYNGSVSFEGLYRACKHVYNSHSLVN